MPPFNMVSAATRSPALTCPSAGALRTTPAASARHERQVWFVLVEAARQQRVGKRDPRGVYVDNHDAVAARLVELYYLHRLRTVEPGYLYRAHRAPSCRK
ncbi:hypothetical protein I553_0093 [Mycobacterium xenopi 4042]|uniref:Uncharacterized protein n=1 Tax=Mycobacterium xenopi 4042 TaxID=1299334 RepID=X7YJ37_MYCXE|nr:hypothetical protein I553_0093 [Mycobacterium xenopi 4042]